jgi:hypothetical protein
MFGDFLVQLDPWQVEYGAALPYEDLGEVADDGIAALDVERAPTLGFMSDFNAGTNKQFLRHYRERPRRGRGTQRGLD